MLWSPQSQQTLRLFKRLPCGLGGSVTKRKGGTGVLPMGEEKSFYKEEKINVLRCRIGRLSSGEEATPFSMVLCCIAVQAK